MYFFSRSSPCQVCDNNGKQPSDLYSFFRSEGKEGWRMAQWIIPEITEMTLQIQLALRTHCWNTLTQDEYLGWLLIKLQLSVHIIYIVNIFLVAKATLEIADQSQSVNLSQFSISYFIIIIKASKSWQRIFFFKLHRRHSGFWPCLHCLPEYKKTESQYERCSHGQQILKGKISNAGQFFVGELFQVGRLLGRI